MSRMAWSSDGAFLQRLPTYIGSGLILEEDSFPSYAWLRTWKFLFWALSIQMEGLVRYLG